MAGINLRDLINSDIKNQIKNDLSIEDQLNESLSAQQKRFTINTDFLSEQNIKNHIALYEGYIENFNASNAKIEADPKNNVNCNHSTFRSLKIDETHNMNGVYLHELYFANIGDPNSNIQMDSLSYMRLSRDFGSFDNWQKDFIACCLGSKNGWAVTYLNTYTQTYMNAMIDDHITNLPAGCFPVIVMDVWQHAYYRDYLKDVKTYVHAMMKQLRWNVIEERIKKGDKIIQVLKGQL